MQPPLLILFTMDTQPQTSGGFKVSQERLENQFKDSYFERYYTDQRVALMQANEEEVNAVMLSLKCKPCKKALATREILRYVSGYEENPQIHDDLWTMYHEQLVLSDIEEAASYYSVCLPLKNTRYRLTNGNLSSYITEQLIDKHYLFIVQLLESLSCYVGQNMDTLSMSPFNCSEYLPIVDSDVMPLRRVFLGFVDSIRRLALLNEHLTELTIEHVNKVARDVLVVYDSDLMYTQDIDFFINPFPPCAVFLFVGAEDAREPVTAVSMDKKMIRRIKREGLYVQFQDYARGEYPVSHLPSHLAKQLLERLMRTSYLDQGEGLEGFEYSKVVSHIESRFSRLGLCVSVAKLLDVAESTIDPEKDNVEQLRLGYRRPVAYDVKESKVNGLLIYHLESCPAIVRFSHPLLCHEAQYSASLENALAENGFVYCVQVAIVSK